MEKFVLSIDSDTFNLFKNDFDMMLNRLIAAMEMRNAVDSTITIKFDIELEKQQVTDKNGDLLKEYVAPHIHHKIDTVIKSKSTIDGSVGGNQYELFYDAAEGKYAMRTLQGTLFDDVSC